MSVGEGNGEAEEGGGKSFWRFARATRAHVVIDAAAYYELMQEAMLRARQRILLVGWDFDTRVHLGTGRRWWNLPRADRYPARLGGFVIWLANRRPGLQVRVLKWNFGALKFVLRGTMIFDLIRWFWHKAIDFKFDSAHPVGCSHHQKFVVIDDCFAACGGIDMTTGRWDTRDHLDEDPRRRRISGKFYDPWHDASMLVEGEAARMLGELGRRRWRQAGGRPMQACPPRDPATPTPWPDKLVAEFRDVEVGIARTRSGYRDIAEVREVEELFLEHVHRARRFIYAESQYFAARRIAEAIAVRLSQPDPPEIVLINPVSAEGWLEQAAMDGARMRLLHAIREHDPQGRFRIFCPVTTGGTAIYVHSKIMIVDDEIVRIGSANMNNRSLGLDSECDLFLDAARPGNGHIVPAITRLRHSLLAEHCGIGVEQVAELLDRHGTMAAMIEAAPRQGKRLEPFVLRPLTETEKAVADSTLLDPETPGEIFEPMSRRLGLFRRGGFLRRPR